MRKKELTGRTIAANDETASSAVMLKEIETYSYFGKVEDFYSQRVQCRQKQ